MTSFLPAAAQPAVRELLMTPARRIILLLGVPLTLTLLAWTCFAIISQASQGSYAVSYAPVRVSGGLDMNVYGGDVTLQGGVAPSASLRLGPAGRCAAASQTFLAVSDALLCPALTCLMASGGTPQVALFSSSAFINRVSAAMNALNSLQTSSGGAFFLLAA